MLEEALVLDSEDGVYQVPRDVRQMNLYPVLSGRTVEASDELGFEKHMREPLAGLVLDCGDPAPRIQSHDGEATRRQLFMMAERSAADDPGSRTQTILSRKHRAPRSQHVVEAQKLLLDEVRVGPHPYIQDQRACVDAGRG